MLFFGVLFFSKAALTAAKSRTNVRCCQPSCEIGGSGLVPPSVDIIEMLQVAIVNWFCLGENPWYHGMMFGGSFCDPSSILTAVGGFILFYTLLFTTIIINFETWAKPGNPTSGIITRKQNYTFKTKPEL